MVRWLGILVKAVRSTLRTQRELALENLALRQQVAVLKPRQPSLGRAQDPRRAVEAGSNGLAGDGFEVHGPASAAAIAGVAHVSEEPRPGADRVGFLHGLHGDLSSPVRARGAEPWAAPAG